MDKKANIYGNRNSYEDNRVNLGLMIDIPYNFAENKFLIPNNNYSIIEDCNPDNKLSLFKKFKLKNIYRKK